MGTLERTICRSPPANSGYRQLTPVPQEDSVGVPHARWSQRDEDDDCSARVKGRA